MPNECEQAYQLLRDLAVRDPKQARGTVCSLLDNNPSFLDELLTLISRPGEGRLRHIVANAVRTRTDKGRVVPYLFLWRNTETDEFARRAISAALEGLEQVWEHGMPQVPVADPALVRGYRYAQERLAHRVRNALDAPAAQVRRIQTRIESANDEALKAEVTVLLCRLREGFQRVARIVEFDPDDEWFKLRPIQLADWLRGMNARYTERYSAIGLSIQQTVTAGKVCVHASDHLLDTIFWNLWINAHHAVNIGCEITVHMEKIDRYVKLLVLDNGSGFESQAAEVAFRGRYSTRKGAHGRGLLEVQAAIEDLHGKAELTRQATGDCRVVLFIPLEGR